MFFPNEFIQSKIPQLQKFIDRKQEAVVTSSRQSFLTTMDQNLPRYTVEKLGFIVKVFLYVVFILTSLPAPSLVKPKLNYIYTQ